MSNAARDLIGFLTDDLDHCADLLCQKLMCDADVGVITYNWVKKYPNYYPSFNTIHKCRHFEEVLAWGKALQAPKPRNKVFEKPLNAVELELPP